MQDDPAREEGEEGKFREGHKVINTGDAITRIIIGFLPSSPPVLIGTHDPTSTLQFAPSCLPLPNCPTIGKARQLKPFPHT